MEIRIGDEIELCIDSLGLSGEGIGTYLGLKVFVEGLLPSEKALVKIIGLKKNYAKGQCLKLLRESSERVRPICPLFGRCGGCQLMHLNYDSQLKMKRKRVMDSFERVGKDPISSPIIIHGSNPSLEYRNKIQLPAKLDNGVLTLGLYEKESHEIIPVKKCYIHATLGESVYEQILSLLQGSGLSAYDEKTGEGELRHVLIKTAMFNQQVLVVLITTQGVSKQIKALAKKIIEIPFVKGVMHHKNSRKDNVILGDHFLLLEGQDFIDELLCGLKFKLSAPSFFQINPYQAQNLYQKAIELASIDKSMTVLDAYCGIGTLSLLLAKNAKEVIGVECVPLAIEDAKYNARKNHIENVKFICSVTEKFIHTLSKIDVVVLNPPRKGCDIKVLEALKKLKPKNIIYISCDPATLARDAQILRNLGFIKDHVEAFDMFPQTTHVETIARFKLF